MLHKFLLPLIINMSLSVCVYFTKPNYDGFTMCVWEGGGEFVFSHQ